MKAVTSFVLVVLLTSCGKSGSVDTVESLVANPDRLAELREQCRTDRAKLGDALCNVVAESARRRFMGDGDVPYTPPAEQPKF
jgi:hypothetical protein